MSSELPPAVPPSPTAPVPQPHVPHPPDNVFYWDWYKHEENLSTNRGNFFLVGESMLFAGYAVLRATSGTSPTGPIWTFCGLGFFVTVVWLLVSWGHLQNTRIRLAERLNDRELRRRELSPLPTHTSGWLRKSYGLIGVVIPLGLMLCWVILMFV